MIYAIFTLFIIYTICCCLDGPDLKPIWEDWLGTKLHKYGNQFVKYVPYYPLDGPPMNVKIYTQHIEPIKIKARSIISEFDLLHNGYNQDRYMDYVKRNNIRKLFEEIENNNLINTEVITNPYNHSIEIESRLEVCKNVILY